ncbi:hypothetical protein DYB25_011337 [Aphanomyces astaci]|uniref:Uncharacterized protein n=2 Tax=Aphanomyces astaci TaxID=112090 RepID=A0A397CYZ8_APHAT|nr:hypothetical protein DYB25_011337 [Aphanomyces astaci]RHY52712.1 hypothetical protein DYB30_010085 [Aphanomyces astaci]
MTDSSIDAAVQALIDSSNGALEVTSVENKDGAKVSRIKCTATGHEMPPRADIVTAHVNSKRFKKATEWYSYDFAQFEPYIVSHRRKPKCLFCNVTGIVLNKIPSEVEKHMQGRKFVRMKEHVKFFDEAEIDKDDEDFDANKFEFLNRQLVGSEDENDSDDGAPKRKGNAANDGGDDEEDIDAIFYKDHSDDDGDNASIGDDDEEDDSDIAGDDDDDDTAKPTAKFVKKVTKPAPCCYVPTLSK